MAVTTWIASDPREHTRLPDVCSNPGTEWVRLQLLMSSLEARSVR